MVLSHHNRSTRAKASRHQQRPDQGPRTGSPGCWFRTAGISNPVERLVSGSTGRGRNGGSNRTARNGKVRTGQGGSGRYFWTARRRSQCQTVSFCCSAAKAAGGGGLKVAARTSSADRKREQERDLGKGRVDGSRESGLNKNRSGFTHTNGGQGGRFQVKMVQGGSAWCPFSFLKQVTVQECHLSTGASAVKHDTTQILTHKPQEPLQ